MCGLFQIDRRILKLIFVDQIDIFIKFHFFHQNNAFKLKSLAYHSLCHLFVIKIPFSSKKKNILENFLNIFFEQNREDFLNFSSNMRNFEMASKSQIDLSVSELQNSL